jgi:hypothetical protein
MPLCAAKMLLHFERQPVRDWPAVLLEIETKRLIDQ